MILIISKNGFHCVGEIISRLKAYEEDEIDKAHNGIQMTLGIMQERNKKLTKWPEGEYEKTKVDLITAQCGYIHTYPYCMYY